MMMEYDHIHGCSSLLFVSVCPTDCGLHTEIQAQSLDIGAPDISILFE